MSLIVEGFERFDTGTVPIVALANRTYDSLGWAMASGPSGGGTLTVNASPISNRRGKCLTFQRVSGSTAQNAAWARLLMPDDTTWTKRIIGFSIFMHQAVTTPSPAITWFAHPNNSLLGSSAALIGGDFGLHPMPDGSIRFGASALADNFVVVPAAENPVGRWVHIEIEFDKSIGGARVYADGVYKGSRTPGVSAAVWETFVSFSFSILQNSTGVNISVDDVYYRDDVGESSAIEPFGPCKIDLATPNATLVGEFEPNTPVSANWEAVGETPINDDTYVTSSSEGQRDLHSLTNPHETAPPNDRILAVQTQTVMRGEIAPVAATIATGVGSNLDTENLIIPVTGKTVARTTYYKKPGTDDDLTIADMANLRSGYAVGSSWPT